MRLDEAPRVRAGTSISLSDEDAADALSTYRSDLRLKSHAWCFPAHYDSEAHTSRPLAAVCHVQNRKQNGEKSAGGRFRGGHVRYNQSRVGRRRPTTGRNSR